MAVYTHLSAEDLAELIAHYEVGELTAAKGIAEGVSNSNWLIETSGADTGPYAGEKQFILTMYEFRIDTNELPFFLGLLDHLSANGSPVPRTIHDREGAAYRAVGGKEVALIEFLPGVSVDRPTPEQARSVGSCLAGIHVGASDFGKARSNQMGLAAWQQLTDECGSNGLAAIDPALPGIVAEELVYLSAHWPGNLAEGVCHADLFPDNVLMLGDKVTGLIDFYFACTDFFAYDLAVTHAAWCFTDHGRSFRKDISEALIAGYEAVRPLSGEERAALPVLARGAAMRFVSTRAFDWLNTPADALVTKKDPMDFVRRMQFYAREGAAIFGA